MYYDVAHLLKESTLPLRQSNDEILRSMASENCCKTNNSNAYSKILPKFSQCVMTYAVTNRSGPF